MKSRVPKNISTQVCLLSTHLGVVLNHQAISSALRGHLPTRFPPYPEAGECWGTGNSEAGGWRLPTELDSNWTEPSLHPHLSLAVSLDKILNPSLRLPICKMGITRPMTA